MFENRNLKFDLLTLVLLAATLLLAISVLSFDATDPPSTLVHPATEVFNNACGPIGAYVAHFLLESIGIGAYYLIVSLATMAVVLLWRGEINQPVLRAVGWAISLLAISTLATMLFPNSTPGPVIGMGGYLGAMGHAVLESNFASTGAYILALTVLLAGMLLCTDYLILKFAAATTVFSGRGIMSLGHLGPPPSLRFGRRVKTDLEDEFEVGEEEEELAEDEEWEYEDEAEETAEDEEWEYEDEEAPTPALKIKTQKTKPTGESASADGDQDQPTSPLKSRLANALRIKKPGKQKPKPKTEREEIHEQLNAADQQAANANDGYEVPPIDLLIESEEVSYEDHEQEVRRNAKLLEETFQNFNFNVKVVEIETGPVIAQYEIELEAGLRLAKIMNLADDLAIALRVPSVRIVSPIPGKNTVGIEVPNKHRQLVRLRDVIEETDNRAMKMKIPVYLGKDVAGNPMVVDLTAMPHLLIAGRTGTGKSVCLNTIIASMLMTRGPDEVRMLMIDPKMVELSGYGKLPHLMHPVVTDMNKAEAILGWAVEKMEERYQLLARAGVRHLSVYNQLDEEELRDRIKPKSEVEWEEIPRTMPYVVIIADEIADLMMTAGKDVEQHIIRLAQKSRAVGIHLILATQKPTVDVITGLIKSNLPARIAFQVASRTDSRVVLDENGADKLLGNGDMLFLSPGTSVLMRGQGTYLTDDELNRVVDYVATDTPQFAKELVELKTKEETEAETPGPLKNRDELYEAAVDVVVRERRGSVSLLQRCLGIGYGRAARLIDFMAEDGIVGEYNGSQAREVAISVAEWDAMRSSSEASTGTDTDNEALAAKPAVPPQESRKIIPDTNILDNHSDDTETPWEDDEDDEEEETEETVEAETEDGLTETLEDEWEEEDEETAEGGEESEAEVEVEEELADDEEWEYEDEDEETAEDEADGELAEDEEWEYEDEEETAEEEEEVEA